MLNDIRRVTEYARTHEEQFVSYTQQKDSKQIQRDIADGQKEIAAMERRIVELTALFRHLYEDKIKGEITPDQFKMLSAGYNEEQKELEAALPIKEAELNRLRESTSNVERFVTKAKQYASIDELTPELLRMFVQRIEVGEREVKGSRNSPQPITIFYRDVGIIDTTNFEVKPQPVKRQTTAKRLTVDSRPTV